MEGAGSRLGRASSRYGPTATVFSGPVRKWKKKWVHVSYNTTHGSRNNNNNNNNKNSTLLLCRWTPIPSTATTASAADKPEGPPRRKCRYAPIVSLEEKKKKDASEKIDDKAKMGMTGSLITETSKNDDPSEKPGTKRASSDEMQAANKKQLKPGTSSNRSHLNLDLELQGDDEKYDSDGENMDETGEANPGQFWA